MSVRCAQSITIGRNVTSFIVLNKYVRLGFRHSLECDVQFNGEEDSSFIRKFGQLRNQFCQFISGVILMFTL